MFCGNCGKEVNSNFCRHCGEKMQDDVVEINENNESNLVSPEELDMTEIEEIFKGNKIEMCKYVKRLTGVSVQEAKTIVDYFYAVDTTPQKYKSTFWQRFAAQVNEINQNKLNDKQELKSRIKQMDKDGTAYCPKCHSTSLSAHKKGFGIGKAVVGAWATGGIGLVAGNIGAKKVRVTCLKCGHQFKAGK